MHPNFVNYLDHQTETVKNRQKQNRKETDRNGKKRIEKIRNGQKGKETDKNREKRTETYGTGQKRTEKDRH